MNLFMGSWINHWSQTRLRVANSYCQRWLYNTIHVNDMVYVYIKVCYITETTHQTSGHHWVNPHGCWAQTEYVSSCNSANMKNICIIFAQCWTNVEEVGRHCANVIQMFCVFWDAFFVIFLIWQGSVFIPYHIYLPVNMTHPPNVEQLSQRRRW